MGMGTEIQCGNCNRAKCKAKGRDTGRLHGGGGDESPKMSKSFLSRKDKEGHFHCRDLEEHYRRYAGWMEVSYDLVTGPGE